MSEFKVEVVRVGQIYKHENADTLSITTVNEGYPVVFRTGDFREGELAVYLPIDSIVPDTEQWAFLKGHRRIKAKRLRGVFSMGMLSKLPLDLTASVQEKDGSTYPLAGVLKEGDDIQELMGVEKWEPEIHNNKLSWADREPDYALLPRYTDIEGLRKHPNVLQPGELVVITEKLDGTNARFLWNEERFYVGSHNVMKKFDGRDTWWKALEGLGLGEKIKKMPGFAFYGEIFGNVQDLKYGMLDKIAVRMFDVLDTKTQRYLDHDEMVKMCAALDIDVVPLLYYGPWEDSLRKLADGPTTFGGVHIREGFVVKPARERYDHRVGRVILKLIGEEYLLRKEK
jgi:RNA ligase (TIGR02306 family)